MQRRLSSEDIFTVDVLVNWQNAYLENSLRWTCREIADMDSLKSDCHLKMPRVHIVNIAVQGDSQ